MIYLSIPTNYDYKYLENVILLNDTANDVKIDEIYASLCCSPIGTIRPNSTLPNIDWKTFKYHVDMAINNNIEFNYIMNSTLLDGSEYTKDGRYIIIKFIENLIASGVKRLTISIPYLIQLIKTYFPEINITASICAEIDSVRKALQFAELGVSTIVPAKDCNRNMRLLRNMANVPNLNIKLLATTPCIFRCSDIFYHMNLSSLRSSSLYDSFKTKDNIISHTAVRCQRKKLIRLDENIKSPWIRPEDMQQYANIGIIHFKIDGRDRTTQYNLHVVQAYFEQSYSGNLLHLMKPSFPRTREEMNREDKIGVYCDNKRLEGFLKPFFSGMIDCVEDCSNCHYCSEWANKAIETNQDSISRYLGELDREHTDRMSIIQNERN